jgi:D-cysteine desulfhydrase
MVRIARVALRPAQRQTRCVDLSNFPRIPLGSWPTPLDACPRLSAALGATVLVKRDDVNGLGLGGNKLRKLEFTLAAALADGADTVITFGGVQTNHGRLTAAACARLGLRCELVLTRAVPRSGFAYDRSGNIALDELFGARVHLCDTDDEADYTAGALASATSVTLPVGGSSGLGVLGYVAAAQELREQIGDQRVDRIVCAAGTGGTVAGLALGADIPVTAVSVSRDAAGTLDKIEGCAALAAKELGVDPPRLDHLDVDDSALGEGYGVPNDEVWAALRLFARTEGIVLDPVYTGKAAAALVTGVRPGETVVFVHTGGVPAIYGYAPDLAAESRR